MDFVFDLSNKNWPTLKTLKLSNEIRVTMGQYGFMAVTTTESGVGKVVVAGYGYKVLLPGAVEDAEKLEVSFRLIN